MTDPEGFLSRWSRKKIEATDVEAPAPKHADEAAPAAKSEPPDHDSIAKAEPPARDQPTAAFDIASLPSIESISEATDIRAFLAPGVPPELTRAALRRAWAADPAIRDFVGLQENDWDFNNPTGVPGFGELPSGYDIKQQLARLFGDADTAPEDTATPNEPATDADTQATPIAQESATGTGPVTSLPPPDASDGGQAKADPEAGKAGVTQLDGELVQRNSHIALQNSIPEGQAEAAKVRPPHGRALPK